MNDKAAFPTRYQSKKLSGTIDMVDGKKRSRHARPPRRQADWEFVRRLPNQFSLSWLIALPMIVSPVFLGFSTGRFVRPRFDEAALLALLMLLYVVALCWLAIRHFDRLNDFRRFPFRGSLLLGGTAGFLFTVQFVLGVLASALTIDLDKMTPELLGAYLLGAILYSIAGGCLGLYFGLVAGGLYCSVRLLAPSRSNVVPKSHRPKHWRREERNAAIGAGEPASDLRVIRSGDRKK